MKRTILSVALIVCACFGVYGQNITPIDLILLLNTSSSMSSSYDTVNEYLTGSFLSEYLRLGDTFHLIVFSDNPRLDAARRVSEAGDVETIIGRMLLQYPIENGSNVEAALTFAQQYITSLPSRPKKIILVSTGDNVNNLVASARQRLNSNTTLDFVQINPGQPLTNLPRSQRGGAVSPQRPAQSGTASASAASVSGTTSTSETTSAQGTVSTSGTASSSQATVASGTASASVPETSTSSQQSQVEVTQESSSPDTLTAVPSPVLTEPSSPSTVGSSDTERRQAVQETKPYDSESVLGLAFSLPVIAIIVIVLLLLAGIIFFALRRGGGRDRVTARSFSSKEDEKDLAPFVDHSNELAQYAAAQTKQRITPYTSRTSKTQVVKTPVIPSTGPLLLNLFVEDQNTNIGKRNIHSLKSGYSLSVGGGNSDFLIFLVSIPPNIGEIRRNGSQCTFIPKKPKYFPDLGASELRDCVNKDIRVVSDKKYEMLIRFEMYENPLDALNRVLMSIKVPG